MHEGLFVDHVKICLHISLLQCDREHLAVGRLRRSSCESRLSAKIRNDNYLLVNIVALAQLGLLFRGLFCSPLPGSRAGLPIQKWRPDEIRPARLVSLWQAAMKVASGGAAPDGPELCCHPHPKAAQKMTVWAEKFAAGPRADGLESFCPYLYVTKSGRGEE